jgi:hypothetical protein
MNALTDKRGALYPSTQSQKRTAASIPTLTVVVAQWQYLNFKFFIQYLSTYNA